MEMENGNVDGRSRAVAHSEKISQTKQKKNIEIKGGLGRANQQRNLNEGNNSNKMQNSLKKVKSSQEWLAALKNCRQREGIPC